MVWNSILIPDEEDKGEIVNEIPEIEFHEFAWTELTKKDCNAENSIEVSPFDIAIEKFMKAQNECEILWTNSDVYLNQMNLDPDIEIDTNPTDTGIDEEYWFVEIEEWDDLYDTLEKVKAKNELISSLYEIYLDLKIMAPSTQNILKTNNWESDSLIQNLEDIIFHKDIKSYKHFLSMLKIYRIWKDINTDILIEGEVVGKPKRSKSETKRKSNVA